MTALTKIIRRLVQIEVISGHRRAMILSLYPGGVIGLREKGRRKELTLPLLTIYMRAAEAEAQRIIAERKATKRGGKRGRAV